MITPGARLSVDVDVVRSPVALLVYRFGFVARSPATRQLFLIVGRAVVTCPAGPVNHVGRCPPAAAGLITWQRCDDQSLMQPANGRHAGAARCTGWHVRPVVMIRRYVVHLTLPLQPATRAVRLVLAVASRALCD